MQNKGNKNKNCSEYEETFDGCFECKYKYYLDSSSKKCEEISKINGCTVYSKYDNKCETCDYTSY